MGPLVVVPELSLSNYLFVTVKVGCQFCRTFNGRVNVIVGSSYSHRHYQLFLFTEFETRPRTETEHRDLTRTTN